MVLLVDVMVLKTWPASQTRAEAAGRRVGVPVYRCLRSGTGNKKSIRPSARTSGARGSARELQRADCPPVLRQNLHPLSGRPPMLSRQAKERLGDCRQEGRPAVRVGRAATEGRRIFLEVGGGEPPDGRTGPIVGTDELESGRPSDVAMVRSEEH